MDDDGKYQFEILGGQDCYIPEPYDFSVKIEHIHSEMVQLYEHEILLEKDKVHLAQMMIRMRDLCNKRTVNSLADQKKYIESLSDNERAQIEKQVQMYNDCRSFYRDYVHNK